LERKSQSREPKFIHLPKLHNPTKSMMAYVCWLPAAESKNLPETITGKRTIPVDVDSVPHCWWCSVLIG